MSGRIQKGVYDFVRNSIKNIADRGVSLEELLHAATSCPRDLPELLRRCRQHTFARLIEANAEEGATRQELLLGVMSDVWEVLSDQFSEEVVGHCPEWTVYEEFHEYLDDIRDHVQGDLERIASFLGDDPEWVPQRPRPRRAAAQVQAPLFDHLSPGEAPAPVDRSTEATRALLGESLLGGRRPDQ